MAEQTRLRTGPVLTGFLYLLLMVGFALGTATLLGPVRWLTTQLRAAGVAPGLENVAVIGVILVYLAASVLLARWLARRMYHANGRRARFGIPAAATAVAALSLWGWMTPGVIAGSGDGELEWVTTASGAQFVFGPYPEQRRLEQLKEAGFVGVISLLHPAVVPFEPKLLSDERKQVAEAGLEFVHAPMLPWVGSNDESLARIRELAASGEGPYYVHCYLGRDRVNVVKRIVEGSGAVAAGASDLQESRRFEERDEPFERGALVQLDEDVWLLPYPNEHELFGYVLFGTVGHVVVALDPTDPEQKRWIEESTKLMREYAVPYTVEPLRADDSTRAARIASLARTLPAPVAVIVPRTRPQPGAGAADAVASAYRQIHGGPR